MCAGCQTDDRSPAPSRRLTERSERQRQALDAVFFQLDQQPLGFRPFFWIIGQVPDGGYWIVEPTDQFKAVAHHARRSFQKPDKVGRAIAARKRPARPVPDAATSIARIVLRFSRSEILRSIFGRKSRSVRAANRAIACGCCEISLSLSFSSGRTQSISLSSPAAFFAAMNLRWGLCGPSIRKPFSEPDCPSSSNR